MEIDNLRVDALASRELTITNCAGFLEVMASKPKEEKPLAKVLILPTDFDAQVEQIWEVIEEIHSKKIVEEVYIKADFNYEDAVNKLILRTKELAEEIGEDAQKWKTIEVTEKDKEEIRSILEEVGNEAITEEMATKAYVESGKKYEDTFDFLSQ